MRENSHLTIYMCICGWGRGPVVVVRFLAMLSSSSHWNISTLLKLRMMGSSLSIHDPTTVIIDHQATNSTFRPTFARSAVDLGCNSETHAMHKLGIQANIDRLNDILESRWSYPRTSFSVGFDENSSHHHILLVSILALEQPLYTGWSLGDREHGFELCG